MNVYIYIIFTIYLLKSPHPGRTTAQIYSSLMKPRYNLDCHLSSGWLFLMTNTSLPTSLKSPFSHISVHILILCFLFYAPFLLCSAAPHKIRSYFYLETHPWTSEQKNPQSFNRFPNWLVVSWILYSMHCSLQNTALFYDSLSITVMVS